MKRKKHIRGSNRPKKFPATIGGSSTNGAPLMGKEGIGMKEKILNLFLYVENGIIHQIGAVCHFHSGTDAEKISFLQAQVMADYLEAKRYTVPDRYIVVSQGIDTPNRLTYATYLRLPEIGKQTELFDEVFEDFGASSTPLICITPIVDGMPRVDEVVNR